MVSAFGLTIGPVLGSFLYSGIGYVNTFYFFTGFISSIGGFCVLIMPKRLNDASENVIDSDVGEDRLTNT